MNEVRASERGFALIDALIATVVVSVGLVAVLDGLTGAYALLHFETQNMKTGLALTGIMEQIDARETSPTAVGTWTAVTTVFTNADYANIDYKVEVPSPDVTIGNVGLMDPLNISAYAVSYRVTVRFKRHHGGYSERQLSGVWGQRT